MFENERAQNDHARALLAHFPIRIKITDTGDLPRAVAIDPDHFGLSLQIEVTGLEGNWNHGVKRCRFGVNVAAVKIAVAAVDAGGPLCDARVERRRRTIRLG